MKPWYRRIYALYKGENFICDGTIKEIAEQTGKSEDFLRYMTFPAYERRCAKRGGPNQLAMVLIED